jgi:hypothetical protein
MIYDILGREVVKLVSEETPAGYQSVIWNTRNSLVNSAEQKVLDFLEFFNILNS